MANAWHHLRFHVHNMVEAPLFRKYLKPVVYLLIAGGFCMSLASLLGVCHDACSEAGKYRFFGMDFGWLGITIFTALFMLRICRSIRFAPVLFISVVSSACGAELWFLLIQKTVIRAWCPACVTIAVIVFLIATVLIFESYLHEEDKVQFGNIFKRLAIPVVSALVGLLVAVFGVAKPEVEAAALDIWLGKSDSQAEVYVFTDWFCPGCRRVEPEIEAGVKGVIKQARVAFVDFAVHAESRNFSPYNLSLQIHEKSKYLQLRAALHDLAQKTKTPSVEDVQAVVAPFNVKFRQMPLNDVMAGMEMYNTLVRKFEATATPTVVVRNAKSGKVYSKMVGYDKIKAADIRAAVQEALK